MTEKPILVPPDTTVETLVEDYVYKYHHDLFPVTEEGCLIGCVATRDIKNVPRDEWRAKMVSRIASPCSAKNAIDAGEDAVNASSRMQRKDRSRLMVTDQGRIVGIIALKDMLKLLALKMDALEDSVGS